MYVSIGSVKAFLSIEQITFLSDRRNSWHRYLPLKGAFLSATALKVALIQKVLMHLSFLQTDKPYYFPELEF